MLGALTIDDSVIGVQFARADLGGSDRRSPIYRGIGLFISNYAKVEAALHMYARKLTGTDDGKARILLAGLRVADISSRIKALLHRSGSPQSGEVASLLRQLDHLTGARHAIVHNGVHFHSDSIAFSHKRFTAKTWDDPKTVTLSLDSLHAMIDDSACIFLRIIALIEPRIWWQFGLPPDRVEDLQEEVSKPWRYPLRPANI